MARIRTIKPEFNKSPSVARLSESAQLFMVKILTEMDDQGRIAWLPRTILGNLYPFDESKDSAFLERVVSELESEGIFMRYEVDGQEYGCFPKWADHQVVKNPSKPKCPEPPSRHISTNTKRLTTSSVGSTETLTESSPLEMGNGNREMGSRNREMGEGLGEGVEILEDDSETVRLEIDDRGIIEAEIVDDDSPPSNQEIWESICREYPTVEGRQRHSSAYSRFDFLITSGVNPSSILEGVRRYRRYIDHTGKEPRFVLSLYSFLEPKERSWDERYDLPKKPIRQSSMHDQKAAADEAVAMFRGTQ